MYENFNNPRYCLHSKRGMGVGSRRLDDSHHFIIMVGTKKPYFAVKRKIIRNFAGGLPYGKLVSMQKHVSKHIKYGL